MKEELDIDTLENNRPNRYREFVFPSRYVSTGSVNLHYILSEEDSSETIMFLHGVPTWSYTFRNIFPVCVAAGYRIIAPDLPGFGKSEKPHEPKFYTIQNMVEALESFMSAMKLKGIFLYGHDWGALLGMILASRSPHLFKGV